MMLHYKAKRLKKGYNPVITAKNSTLRLLEFGQISLTGKGARYEAETGRNEEVLDIFSGRCDISILYKGQEENWRELGGRKDIFSGLPTMVYLPRGIKYVIRAIDDVLIGVLKSPARKDTEPALVRPDEVDVKMVGKHNWQRRVAAGVGVNVNADRLIVGETINPPGNWSGYPPHKHDTKKGSEAPYEEIYFFLLKPSQGFGMQRIYTAKDDRRPIDEAYVLRDGDAVVIPRGYHPVVAGAGYQLAYLWGLAGEERKYAAWADDPDHAWLRNCEAII
ncbi:MAG: 5-deoxy-glucuronate isomerase [Candidatus Omnitrophica bacterium]|nr:5-deoxy-glucuronate isomerase [Candidatus Omnitrophota bacterium]